MVSDMAKIGDAIYLWGLDYEFENCPLIRLPLIGIGKGTPATQLSKNGGLLVRIEGDAFYFLENTDITDEFKEESGGLERVASPAISSMGLSSVHFVPNYDFFVGVVRPSY